MVTLPTINSSQTELTQAPQSGVSGAYVSSAFSKLAQGMDAVGMNFQAAQDEKASLEGQNAVYRDADGNLQ